MMRLKIKNQRLLSIPEAPCGTYIELFKVSGERD